MAISSENQKWLIIGAALVIIASIHAVTTRYINTHPNLVLDKWTGEIHVSYHAQKSNPSSPQAVATKKEEKDFDPVAFLDEDTPKKSIPLTGKFVYIQDAQGNISKVDAPPDGYDLVLNPGSKIVPAP